MSCMLPEFFTILNPSAQLSTPPGLGSDCVCGCFSFVLIKLGSNCPSLGWAATGHPILGQLRRLPPMEKTTQKIPPRGLPSTRPRTKQQSQPPIHDPNGRFLPFPKFSMKTNENRTQTQSGKTFRSCFLRLLQLRLLPAIAKTFFIPQRGATKHNQAKDSLGHSSFGSPPHFRTVEGWASPF